MTNEPARCGVRKASGLTTRAYSGSETTGVTGTTGVRQEAKVESSDRFLQAKTKMILVRAVYHRTRESSFPTTGLAEERTDTSGNHTNVCPGAFRNIKDFF